MLKFEGLEIGTVIRAYDFQPLEGRPDCFVEGTIFDVSEKHGFKAYHIRCELDSLDSVRLIGFSKEFSRIGKEVVVPMQLPSFMEFDERITVIWK